MIAWWRRGRLQRRRPSATCARSVRRSAHAGSHKRCTGGTFLSAPAISGMVRLVRGRAADAEGGAGRPRCPASIACRYTRPPGLGDQFLFACERASRADPAGIDAVAAAIATALTIDPILAAEMIYRAAEDVWVRVQDNTLAFICRWHVPGVVDRAVRFMITSGRPEFAPQIWPLVENADSQVHLSAMRAARRFRPSTLGSDAAGRLASLPQETRQNVLAELAMQGGPEGIELAAAVAKGDPRAEVQFAVVEALLFRRAENRSRTAGRGCSAGLADARGEGICGRNHRSGRARTLRKGSERAVRTRSGSRWRALVGFWLRRTPARQTGTDRGGDRGCRLSGARPECFVGRCKERGSAIPNKSAQGLLRRLEAGRDLPYRASEMLAAVAPVDDGPIAATATNPDAAAPLAHVAASVIGPRTAGSLINSLLALADEIAAAAGRYDKAASERCHNLKDRIPLYATGLFRVGFVLARPNRPSAPDRTACRFAGGHGTDEFAPKALLWWRTMFAGS